MTKAISTTITAALATTPALPPPSRRQLLARSGVGVALATIGLPAVGAARVAQPDPVLALYAEWRRLEDAQAIVDRRHEELRDDFVRLYGEHSVAGAAWEQDPRGPELSALGDQSDELIALETDQLDAIMEAPAISLEGVRCKLLAAVHVHCFVERRGDKLEYHDELTLSVMRDAVRVLGGSASA